MRTSEYYGVQVPELGDRADITVVSQAIIDSEDNQSGKVENMKATLSGSTISLVSESRTDKLVKYYNGLAVQFISPVNAQAGTAYKIKVDNLVEQPYNNKVDIKVGDIVQAIYGGTGFVSANTPIPRSSSTSSSSEVTVATSLAVKNANDNANTRALKTTQIIAGNGLIGGGALNTNRTINVASADDSIDVGADNIKVNTYNGVDGTSTTRPASANAVKQANDNANTRALKTVQVVAGKGLTGGGDMSTNRTINVVSRNDGIIVNDNDIQLNVYDGVDSSSITRAGSARSVKMAYDKGVEGLNKANTKLDAGSVSTEYNTAKKIEDKIKAKIDKTAIVNDLTTGGADKVGSAEMVKKLNNDKVNKNGDKMTGALSIDTTQNNKISLFNNSNIAGHIGYNYGGKFSFFYNAKSTKALQMFDDGGMLLPAANLRTSSKEVVEAINSYGYIDVIESQSKQYFDTITQPGVYLVANSPIFDGAYLFGTLVVYRAANCTCQVYYPDVGGMPTYVRDRWDSGRNWLGWHILGGDYTYAGRLIEVGQSYTITKEVFELLINGFDDFEKGYLSSSVIITNNNISHQKRIRRYGYSGAPQEGQRFEYDIEITGKTLTLRSRGANSDGGVNIYIK